MNFIDLDNRQVPGEPQDSHWTTINFDANANVAPTARVIEAVVDALTAAGNPSSAHGGGEAPRRVLAEARDALASLVEDAFPENIHFTSGCTEANNQIVATARSSAAAFVTSAVEHASILSPAEAWASQGGDVYILGVDADGILCLEDLSLLLDSLGGTVVVSIQAANSETGVLQPLAEIVRRVRARPDTALHVDAAQAFGRVPLSLGPEGPDLYSVSGHKLHAPAGIGAILRREGESRLLPFQAGGNQEGGLRAGTEAVTLIAGFGAACSERDETMAVASAHMSHLRDLLEEQLLRLLPGSTVNGGRSLRVPNTTNIRFPGVDGTNLLALLDDRGIYASQGSACHSRRPEPSSVLKAMGLSDADAYGSVRFSVSPLNTVAEVDEAVPAIVEACHRSGYRP